MMPSISVMSVLMPIVCPFRSMMALHQFIFKLHELGSLDEVRKEFSKATYYRHLKKCQNLGYIKEGKLIKKVFV